MTRRRTRIRPGYLGRVTLAQLDAAANQPEPDAHPDDTEETDA